VVRPVVRVFWAVLAAIIFINYFRPPVWQFVRRGGDANRTQSGSFAQLIFLDVIWRTGWRYHSEQIFFHLLFSSRIIKRSFFYLQP